MNLKVFVPVVAAALAGCVCCGEKSCDAKCAAKCADPVMGSWGNRLPYPAMNAGHMIFSRDNRGAAQAVVLWCWGSPVPCTDVKVEGNAFSFEHPYGVTYRGKVCGDRMFGEVATVTKDKDGRRVVGEFKRFEGWRNPPVAPANTADAKFGPKIDLLKDGLAGWQPLESEGKFGWSFKDGVLSNRLGLNEKGEWAGGGVNLCTKRSDFYDFKMTYDVRVPKGSNSGVYLRGRYECQVIDSFGKKVDCHNMGAYYGRVTPSVAAEKAPGEWQHVEVTLFRRHITVVLNGVTIIDNAPVEGITGGAIDAHEFVNGPIYLQGDHSDADYRNMFLYPAL